MSYIFPPLISFQKAKNEQEKNRANAFEWQKREIERYNCNVFVGATYIQQSASESSDNVHTHRFSKDAMLVLHSL